MEVNNKGFMMLYSHSFQIVERSRFKFPREIKLVDNVGGFVVGLSCYLLSKSESESRS